MQGSTDRWNNDWVADNIEQLPQPRGDGPRGALQALIDLGLKARNAIADRLAVRVSTVHSLQDFFVQYLTTAVHVLSRLETRKMVKWINYDVQRTAA